MFLTLITLGCETKFSPQVIQPGTAINIEFEMDLSPLETEQFRDALVLYAGRSERAGHPMGVRIGSQIDKNFEIDTVGECSRANIIVNHILKEIGNTGNKIKIISCVRLN